MNRLDDFAIGLLDAYFGFDLTAHEALLDAMQPLELAGGDWLFHQGDPGDALYFLLRGRMQVWREASGQHPAELLGEVVPGESVGEVGLLTNAPRSASTRAVRDCLLLRVDRATLDALAQKQPALIMQLAASVAERLQQNTATGRRMRPQLKAIAIVAMDAKPQLLELADRLVDALCAQRDAQALRLEQLRNLGAPCGVAPREADLDPALKHWIGSVEDRRGCIVYRATPAEGPWLRYALRHADLVVRIGAADGSPALRPWEEAMAPHLQAGLDAHQLLLLWHPQGRDRIHDTAAWLQPRPTVAPLHLRADYPKDWERLLRILGGRATGLVLGGGAARGFAHLGVYRAMEQLGVPVDWVGGTSIGAIMGAAIAHDWGVDQAIANTREAFVGGKPFGDYTLPVISLLRGRRMQRLSARFFPGAIEDLPIPFFCVSSNLGTGNVNLHERGLVWQATCASAALPGVMPPAVHQGQLAVDGAMLNNLPVDLMQDKLVGQVVAVDLTSRRQTEVAFDEVPSPWAVLRGRLLPFSKRFGKRYSLPGAATMMLKATELGTRHRVLELASRADLLLRPPVGRFSMLSVQHFDEVVAAGQDHAMEQVAAWLDRSEQRQLS